MGESILTKYRPTELDEVVGHEKIRRMLDRVLAQDSVPHAFLFSGPAGLGKTTFARIVARKVGCDPRNLLEIDAASHTGIDAMREITSQVRFAPLGGAASRVVIIDEAHALSKAAWDSLLKSLEDSPDHVYWVFCTTLKHKVPKTVISRCLDYDLDLVDKDGIFSLLVRVAKGEKMQMSEDVLALITRQARGCPRRALSLLIKCGPCKGVKEAKKRLREMTTDEKQVIDLCRALVRGISFREACEYLKTIDEKNPEAIRIVVTAYFITMAMGAKGDKQAVKALQVLDAFSEPCIATSGFAPTLLSLGELLLHD